MYSNNYLSSKQEKNNDLVLSNNLEYNNNNNYDNNINLINFNIDRRLKKENDYL